MKHSHKQHKSITSNVKNKIESLEIVFPSQYGKLYLEEAHSLNIELHPDEMLAPEMLNEKVIQHVIMLSSCAERAIVAIENEDKKTLTIVLEETKQLRHQIDELKKIIYEDTLTKCYNRKWFEDTYLDTVSSTLRAAGTMVIVDLNKFKIINDTYGHTVGDKVLVYFASKLKEIDEKVIRYGGDEFLMLFDDSLAVSEIINDMEKMIDDCAKKSFKVKNVNFKVGFSYGIASFSAGSELNVVIDLADKAMYDHKRKS